jgi:phage minor structural protein
LLTSGTYAGGDTGGGDTGFELGINEAENDAPQTLTWSDEATVTERLLDIAGKFECEIGFRFQIDGMAITHKYVDVYKTMGKDLGTQLRLGIDVERIVTKTSIANLATALKVTGGDGPSGTPINLEGYIYDDGDYFVASGSLLCSREAHDKWSRYLYPQEPETVKNGSGDIIKVFTSETVSQAELCAEAIRELTKLREPEVNYEVELSHLPDGVKLGDRVTIVDDEGEQYLSARILKLETSETEDTRTVTLGEYVLRNSGISDKVSELAAEVAAAAQANKINFVSQNITVGGLTLYSAAPLDPIIPTCRMVYDQVSGSFNTGYDWEAANGVSENPPDMTAIWTVLLQAISGDVLYPLFISQLYADKAVLDGDMSAAGKVSAESVITPVLYTNAVRALPQIATHTAFTDSAISGTVRVVQKLGWCVVSAEIGLTTGIGANWTDVLSGLPVPQHGQAVCTTVQAEGDGSADPLSTRITTGGALQIKYGDGGTFCFQLMYPVL